MLYEVEAPFFPESLPQSRDSISEGHRDESNEDEFWDFVPGKKFFFSLGFNFEPGRRQ